MRTIGALQIHIGDHHLLRLSDSGDLNLDSQWRCDLFEVYNVGATVFTGISMGPVWLQAEEWLAEPPLDLATWDDVAEATVKSPAGELLALDPFGVGRACLLLTPRGPGDFRIRVHARGRSLQYDLAVNEPCEDYLLQIWPAPLSDGTPLGIVHKETDPQAANHPAV